MLSKGTFCGRGHSSTEDGTYDTEIYWNGIFSIKYYILKSHNSLDGLVPDCDGGWSEWGPWSTCSVTCGDRSSHSRVYHRTCDNPPQSGNGAPCEGSSAAYTSCNIYDCSPGKGFIVTIIGNGWNQSSFFSEPRLLRL